MGSAGTQLWIPGTAVSLQLGYLYYVLVLLLLVGTTNAVNLTDGLDGLVSFVSLPVMATYAFVAWQAGEGELCLFAMAVLGSCLGFLVWNHYPAKVFMGDTGSLALGGAVASLALLTHTELLLAFVGGLYAVSYTHLDVYKRQGCIFPSAGYGGKRLFLYARRSFGHAYGSANREDSGVRSEYLQ